VRQDAWFMNFTSCGTDAREANPRDFAEGGSNINATVFTYFLTHERGRYGTIAIDFVEEPLGLIHLIIDSNSAHIEESRAVSGTPASQPDVLAEA
jgi:hypothetical protein